MLCISSCKKSTEESTSAPSTLQEKAGNRNIDGKSLVKAGDVLYRAPEKELQEKLRTNQQKMIAELNAKSGGTSESWPSYQCALFTSESSVLKSVTVVNGSIMCGGPADIEVVYTWTVIERAGAVSPAYSFTVAPNIVFGSTYTGSAVLVSGPTGINCHPDWGCQYTSYVYDVTVTMDYYNFTASNTTNTATATHTSSLCKGQAPVTLSHTGSLDFPCSYYTTVQPYAGVFGGTGQVSVYDVCTVCPNGAPPHTLCPNTLSFEYRLTGSTPWSSPVTITGFGNISLSAGNYDYRCTANYSCGSSLPRTGTFVVN